MKNQPHEVGPRILQACLALIPCDQGDAAFRWIAKDWEGKGATCGFLVSGVMWLAGVRGSIVNRSDEGCTYRVGANVSAIYNAGAPPFRRHKPGQELEPGTILFLSEGPPRSEHLVVIAEAGTTYEGGQVDTKGEAMRQCHRSYDGRKLGGRTIVGGISPRDMPVLADDIDVAHVLPAEWFSRPLRDPFTGR